VVSTLLPRLPRSEMDTFRNCLLVGTAITVLVAALGFFSVALVAAAFVVPSLVIIYMHDVDAFEDEPVRVLLATAAWGLVAGAVFGVVLSAAFGDGFIPAQASASALALRLVVVPIVAGALMLAGPLVMLPYRNFNDVLDGATFGAVSAATFTGAQAVAQAADLLKAGPHPGGDTFSWVLRILVHGVFLPLIAAGGVGATAGAFWSRYRAPARDRARLGLLGNPIVACVALAALLIAATAAQVLLQDVVRLVAEALLAAIALVWLRLVVHLGLLQEARELIEASDIQCPNCGRDTPWASFCAECGVSLRALPRVGSGHRQVGQGADAGALAP
ncbi:MAG: hypothetical protein QOH61_2597, partial [Chloroflexota bacterium]|nr:hypothetical protein [Chloroflexota bacterium]